MKPSQFVIAVFDDWDAVEELLASLSSDKIGRLGALLHTRTDEPSMQAVPWLVQDMTELHFAASRSRVRCTGGRLAAHLAMRLAGGARDLAHALRGWVSPEQAKELQWHVESGRLVHWLQPSRPEDFETVCAQWCRQVRTWSNSPTRGSISKRRDRWIPPSKDQGWNHTWVGIGFG